ncbi:inturned planar cell polarity protein isoform X2 [Tachypleus tridentatus]|uniref:inturned planar cell polarity protein isoform X2 n=1 Tax=Tachypleus tridentatus TaxID=6853 RepID=UPI003FD18098
MSVLDSYKIGTQKEENGEFEAEDEDSVSDMSDETDVSDSSFSSDLSSDDDAYKPNWVDKVKENGELFYIEPVVNQVTEEETVLCSKSQNDMQIQNGDEVEVKTKIPEVAKNVQGKKFKKWVLRQKGEKKENVIQGISCSVNGNTKECHSKVKFQSSPDGEIKEVFLDIGPKCHNYGRRATLCEALFGIIPGSFNADTELGETSNQNDLRVMIQGFTPDGEAVRNGNIKIGDWLKSIDEKEVTHENLNEVLDAIKRPSKVKLSVQRFAGHSSPQTVKTDHHGPPQSLLVKQVSGDKSTIEEIGSLYQNMPYVLLYLSTANTEEQNDVLYQYPGNENSLLSLKGMFITLNRVVADVTLSPPISSSIVVKDSLVHVGYAHEGSDLMVLALPGSCVSVPETQHLTTQVERLVKLQYQTLGRAFGKSDNKSSLDHFFHLLFHQFLSRTSGNLFHPIAPFIQCLPGVHKLVTSPELQTQIDSVLSEFESGVFDGMSEALYDSQRLYSILGSCLFYKGYLLCNHLPKEDLMDIYLFVLHYQLLSLIAQEPVAQLVVWREVFPTRRFRNQQETETEEFQEPDGRWFLLVVALRHSLLGVLLEAGGCAVSVESPAVPPLASPDNFLSKAKNPKKNQSKEQNSANFKASPIKSLYQKSLSQSNLYFSGTIPQGQGPGEKKQLEMTSILKKKLNPDGERQQLIPSSIPFDTESDADTTNSPGGASDDTPVLGRQAERDHNGQMSTSSDGDSRASSEGGFYRGFKCQRMFASNFDLSSLRRSLEEAEEEDTEFVKPKLVRGLENTLFHFVHVDESEGVLIAPTRHATKWFHGQAHAELVNNFHKCCLNIRRVFQHSLRCKEMAKQKETCKFGIDKSLTAIKEHGVLFHYRPPASDNSKKVQPTLAYWVVGRLFYSPEPREVYVCFHDSAPQDAVELAFRLTFGISS